MKILFKSFIAAFLLLSMLVSCTDTTGTGYEKPSEGESAGQTTAKESETGTLADSETEKTSETASQTESKTETEGTTESTTESTTENKSESEPESVTEEATEAETVYAGENAPERDGTPKKYFTLSFDDGITQDLKIIEILKKYDVKCITFNINTGLYGAKWDWVAGAINVPGTVHQRFTKEELMSGVYDGYDVEVHTLTHTSLKNYDSEKGIRQLVREVQKDADNIYEITGIYPVGMAWPGGDTEYTEITIKNVYENTTIRFGRATTPTHSFALPDYFLYWQPTCSISDQSVLTLAQQFAKAPCDEDMLFYVWGHGYELDAYDLYDELEALIKLMSETEDIVLVTNAEFYQMFKDEIPSYKDTESAGN